MSRVSRAEAEAQLRRPASDGSFLELLKRLPEDVDADLAAGAILPLLNAEASKSTWIFARNCQSLPEPVIRALLRRLSDQGARPAHVIFLLEAVRDTKPAELATAWRRALTVYLDLVTTYSWGSKQLRAKFKALALDPTILAALQAAVVGGADATMTMLAVLAADGSEASADALLPHFVGEETNKLRLNQLERLKTHAAKTPAMAAMLAEIDRRVQEHHATSPALAFARARGLSTKRLVVFVRFQGTSSSFWRLTASYQGEITIDSTSSTWMKVEVSRRPLDRNAITSFTEVAILRDDLLSRGAQRPTCRRGSPRRSTSWVSPGVKPRRSSAPSARRNARSSSSGSSPPREQKLSPVADGSRGRRGKPVKMKQALVFICALGPVLPTRSSAGCQLRS